MKSLLIVLSVIGLGACQHWGGQPGVPQDTPEVAAAKAAHFAAVAQVQPQQPQQQWNQQPQQQWNQQPQQTWNQPQAQQPWRGPIALPPGFDQNGAPLPVQDTAEVQAERSRHFSLYTSGAHITQQAPNWNGAPAQQNWNAAPAQQNWNAAPAQQTWNAPPAQNWNAQPAQNWNAQPAQNWNQQQPGLPVDTAEVAAAKAAHFAAHAQLGRH